MKKTLLKESSIEIMGKAGSISPLGGEFISSAIENLLKNNEKKKEIVNSIFSQEELQIIHKIEHLCDCDKTCVFLCDDVQYWDEKSIQFLYLLINNTYSSIKFLNDPLFIISITKDNKCYIDLSSICNLAHNHIYHIEEIKATDYELVLKKLGLSIDLHADVVSALFSLSSGNLQLSQEIINLLNSSEHTPEETISKLIKEKNLGHLLIERLNSMPFGVDVNETLKYASLFGNTFRYFELEKALQLNEGTIRKNLTNAETYSLVKTYVTSATFVHELIRNAYKDELFFEKEKYYLKFSECIKLLYPGSYQLRKNSLYCAGEYEQANIVSVLEILKAFRMNIKNSENKLYDSPNKNILNEYIEKMKIAYEHFNQGEFKMCLNSLSLIEDIYTPILLAEKYYLYSITLSKWLDVDFRTEAHKCLEPFLELAFIDNETEVWERIISAYTVACIHDNQRDKAEEYEKILELSIAKRLNYDFDASCKLNILRRKASMIHNEEKAFSLTQSSKEFFSENTNKSPDPLQCYMSLTNFLAAALKNGQIESLTDDIANLVELPSKYSYLHFQRLEIPINNIVIILSIKNELSSHEAIRILNATLKLYTPEDTTQIIILSNIAIMFGIAGDFKKALQILKGLYNKFCCLENLEFYYRYIIEINLSAIHFAMGNKDIAINIIENLLFGNTFTSKKSFSLHANQLLMSMKENRFLSNVNWYKEQLKYPEPRTPVPSFWKYYGNKYLFGELEFWSES